MSWRGLLNAAVTTILGFSTFTLGHLFAQELEPKRHALERKRLEAEFARQLREAITRHLSEKE